MKDGASLLTLITLCLFLEMTLPEEKICRLPTNVKMDLYPGLVNVTWHCNVTQASEECHYEIVLQNKAVITFNVSACFLSYDIVEDMDITIHNGLDASIKVYNGSYENSVLASKEVTATPEGKVNSAAENFSCVVYNVSIVNCSWIAGREAPKDTQYFLQFRNDSDGLWCDDYRTDAGGRHIGCMWKAARMDFTLTYYVQLLGSSNDASIRFFDALLRMNDYVILDPPRNIYANSSGSSELRITWEEPETYTKSHKNCFLYDININGVIKANLKGNSYITHILPNQRISVSMRVKWKASCSKITECSRWSQLIVYDPNSGSARLGLPYTLIILAVVTASALLFFMFLCHRFHVWKKLFPKVPKPTLKFLDQAEQKEFSVMPLLCNGATETTQHIYIFTKEGQKMTKMAHLPKKEDDEECICSQITEIPNGGMWEESSVQNTS